MEKTLQLLICEDVESDAAMVIRSLEKGGYAINSRRVESADEMRSALRAQRWDVVISDYSIPGFGGPQALSVLRSSDNDIPFILISGTFRPSYTHMDDLVAEIQKKIEINYMEIETIEAVIKDIPASRRNIVRRFKQATGIPPIEYLQQIRIESAKKLFEQTNQNISEVIINTGYTDPKSFRKIFRKIVGMTPVEYREKFKLK